MENLLKVTLVTSGVALLGYATMKLCTPSKEKILEMLPSDLKSKERLLEIEKRNEKVFAAIQRSANSNNPIWKVDNELLDSSKHK